MELLVVITIIGILISLLLPAVQSAREQSRMTECRNHIKQLALGMIAHESAIGYLPTGGWGFAWTGDPDCGTGLRQPGGWCYCILPYIDQAALAQIGAGLPSGSNAKQTALGTLVTTPLEFLHCPDRRLPGLYPNRGQPQANCVNPDNVAKTDYAANGGDSKYIDATQVPQPGSYSQGNTASWWAGHPQNTGVNVQHCELKMAAITDGLSNTCLIGEKYLDTDNYLTSASGGDNENAYTGLNWDCIRTSATGASGTTYNYVPPQQDTPGFEDVWRFGSAHSGRFNMSFCDGSVRAIDYTITPETFRLLCNRADGKPVDAGSL